MAEELALKKAKINQGKEIDENKLAQGNDDGGFQVDESISIKTYQYFYSNLQNIGGKYHFTFIGHFLTLCQ